MGNEVYDGPLEQIDECAWRIPKSYRPGMRVDGIIFATRELLEQVRKDQAPQQVVNVAHLPGIQVASYAMPDIHWGYGFPIGGVCATDPDEGGVVSPGGVGYDINCGVRLLRTNIQHEELKPFMSRLVERMHAEIPTGVGKGGKYAFDGTKLRAMMSEGLPFLRDRGLATERDVELTEAGGRIPGAEPGSVSERALDRGFDQCGTVGSGNHFVEIQVVDRIEDRKVATVFGLEVGQICVLVHSGSRGLGYQVCDDALRDLRDVPKKYGIELPDRQLACAPVKSPEGQKYLGAMRAAANFAFCNRQLLGWQVREVFAHVLGKPWQQLGLDVLYDVAHNIAKFEEHAVGRKHKTLCVHRKGATRAFPPGHAEVPECYRAVGQPVIIPGDMGRASWILAGQQGSMERSFGTTCHGAGRQMSRTAATRSARGRDIADELLARGVIACASSRDGLAEEQPDAYKNVDDVVEVVHRAGLSRRVARLRPLGVIKG